MADIPAGASAVAATKFPMFFVHIRSILDVGCFPVPKYVMGGFPSYALSKVSTRSLLFSMRASE